MKRWGIPVLVLFVLGAWLSSYFYLTGRFGSPETSGAAGDTFGAINALFSGLALGGVILAIFLQREELRLQRKELALSRQEMQAQNETLRMQRFENTFFGMLALHNEILGQLTYYRNNGPTDRGRDVFKTYYERLSIQYQSSVTHLKDSGVTNPSAIVEHAYDRFFSAYQAQMGHYFRNLYQIVKLLDRTKVPDKRFYVGLVRAQLSSGELLLLFYNCVSPKGRERFKPLIEEYGLLEGVPQEHLLDATHAGMYKHTAFGTGESE